MKTCVVCGNQLPDEAMVCSRCGFPMHQRAFLSEAHYRAWMREVIEPCRIDWHRRDIEQQRKQLAEQQRQLEEQKRLFEEQKQSEEPTPQQERKQSDQKAESKPAWDDKETKKEKPKKEEKPKKKGGLVKNALIAIVVFLLASVVGWNLMAPNLTPSLSDTGAASSNIESSIDNTEETVELSQEQLDKAAEVGFDLNLFENLPLTSREDIIAWLNENKYQYEENNKEGNWTVNIIMNGEQLIEVISFHAPDGSQSGYQMNYYYNSAHDEDVQYQGVVDELMKTLHQKRNYELSSGEQYYDGVKGYIIYGEMASKNVWKRSDQNEIEDQTDLLLSILKELPDISDKQRTLNWITNSSMTYNLDEEYDEYHTMNFGIWQGVYFSGFQWVFTLNAGNMKDYYNTIKKKLTDSGFEFGQEIAEDNGQYTYETQSNTIRIQMICDPVFHFVDLYVEPLNQ